MNEHVSWLLELDVHPGKAGELRTLMREMVAATEANEPGTLDYEWSVSGDDSSCHIFERYADSAAAMIHARTFGSRFAERFLQVVSPTRLVLYGSPSPELAAALEGFSPVRMKSIGGFSR